MTCRRAGIRCSESHGPEEAPEATFRRPGILRWKATGDPSHLEEAHRLLEYARQHAPEEYRETMVANHPLHRYFAAAWNEHGTATGRGSSGAETENPGAIPS
jgi:hypothetical protein